jgi:hypothetical protein
MPTRLAPTLLVSGIAMHRVKDTDPWQDTLNKIKAVEPLHGEILNTATCLGYSAIEAARSASKLITIELDADMMEIARLNPWSRQRFEDPKIERRICDSNEIVETYDKGRFEIVLHDPPTIALNGDLYGMEFYSRLHRVLKKLGKLFHYI